MINTNKEFVRKFLTIAIPMSLQQLMISSLSMVDTIMVGKLGDLAIASVGIGSQVYFVVNLFLLGVGGGCSMFASQFFGKQDYGSIKKVVCLGLCTGVIIVILFTVIIFNYPTKTISLFTNDITIVNNGLTYLKIISLSFVLVTITTVYSSIIRSIGNAILPMLISFVGITLNTVLNYILIFGKLGAPQLGIKGAAIATLVSRIVEMTLLLLLIYVQKGFAAATLRDLFSIPTSLFKRFLSQSGLMVSKDLVWGIGTTMYIGVFGRISMESLAAINIQQVTSSLMYVFIYGIAQACLIIVGQHLGKGEKSIAYDYALFFRRIAVFVGIIVSIIMILIRPIIIKPFNVSESVITLVYGMLLVKGLAFSLVCYNNISVIGILRSGGDTMFCLVMDVFAVWVIGLSLAIVTGLVFKASAVWVLVAITSQEIFKAILLNRRVKSRKWLNSLVHDI